MRILMRTGTERSIKIFYSYAQEDRALRDELDSHLSTLRRTKHIITWDDHKIQPGLEWKQAIDKQLNSADIILLLLSPHFIESDHCYNVEMSRALERHKKGEARVIPIILRPV